MKESYKDIETSIGKLLVFRLTLKERISIEEELGTDFEKINSKKYIRTLTKYICQKTSISKDFENESQVCSLTADDIKNLSDSDLELIASTYVNSNSFLFRERISESKKNENGIDQISISYGKVEFPKHEDESYIDYLLRLEIEQNKKQRKAFENTFGKISSFSKSIQDSIRATASLGDSFKSAISAIQFPKVPIIEPVVLQYPKLDVSFISKQINEMEQRPMTVVSTGIDELIEINTKSLEFLTETNRTQTLIANEIKASSITSSILTKWNIVISIIVLLISLSALFISIQSNKQTDINNSNHVRSIVSSIEKINKNTEDISKNTSQQKREIMFLSSEIDSLKKENQNLLDELNKAKLQIDMINKNKNTP